MQRSFLQRSTKNYNSFCRLSTYTLSHSFRVYNTQSLNLILGPEDRKRLDVALRVDQAGEVAANWIYKGQMDVLGDKQPFGGIIQVSLYSLPRGLLNDLFSPFRKCGIRRRNIYKS